MPMGWISSEFLAISILVIEKAITFPSREILFASCQQNLKRYVFKINLHLTFERQV